MKLISYTESWMDEEEDNVVSVSDLLWLLRDSTLKIEDRITKVEDTLRIIISKLAKQDEFSLEELLRLPIVYEDYWEDYSDIEVVE
jgi:hypothetical protein